MENIKIINDLVSIIVPVYNAEKSIGFCLNSIASQTYQDIEIIIINDGSKDSSLEICKNYAEIDERVKIIDIPNGGVSNARNIGIENAKGAFIQFVDSDDVIAPEMTKKMVEQIKTYEADIVFCGMKIIDVDQEYLQGKVANVFSSGKIGKECVLNKKKFCEEFPKLLFDTVLLEGPCNKLYKNKIIKDDIIRFPLDISLGEDFLFNIKYFEHSNKFVFTSEELYYYMQANTDSLTQIYRADLLQNKIRLLEAYNNFMNKMHAWTPEGEVWYADYCVGYFISALKNLFSKKANLTEREIKAQIEKIINNSIFRNNIYKAGWITEQWVWIKDCVRYSDIGTIYERGSRLTC